MERKKTRLNESEMKVMQIIWNAGHPITGQQVLGQITEQYKGSWHPRTIYPLMRKLTSGLLFAGQNENQTNLWILCPQL